MSIQIIPFNNELLPSAAQLLARRHTNNRKEIPELPSRFQDPPAAEEAIQAALQQQHPAGFAALDCGRLVAYLIGDLVIDSTWGRTGWIRQPGCAYDPAAGAGVICDLYAALGAHWVEWGVLTHFVLTPAADPTLNQSWFSLGFGIEQVHALADLESLAPAMPDIPPGLEIRRVGPGDSHHLAELSEIIWKSYLQAPIWAVTLPEAGAEIREGWAEMGGDPQVTAWLALRGDKALAIQVYWAVEQTAEGMHIPNQCVHLSVSATRPEEQGQGTGTLLTRYGLAQARQTGYSFCETDWRSANLQSARFWPHRGFHPAVYRLARRIDPRIGWARNTL